jgi:hypothetical protein
MTDFTCITDYISIRPDQIEAARDAGLCIHHEVETQQYGYATDEDGVYDWVDETIRDEWFAAHPSWVENYHRNGGIWAYAD